MDEQKLFEQLENLGMDTQEALNRFMGNKPLFLSFVRQLPEKLDLSRIRQALAEENEDIFYMGVHNLKGLAANLSIVPIRDCAQAILVEFRGTKFKNKKKITSLLREAETESKSVAGLINQYLAEEEHV